MSLSERLREVAAGLEERHVGDTLKFSSQNLGTGDVPPEFVVEELRGSLNYVSVRGERLSHDSVVFQGRWIVDGGRGRGIFQTPDGVLYRVVGRVGDAWDAASMSFKKVSEDEASAIIVGALSSTG